MNPRERTLAACVVGVLLLAGLYVAVKWGVYDRWQNLHNEIRDAARRQTDLRRRLEVARKAEQRWAEFKPLSHNPDRAQDVFRRDITELLDRRGLGTECTIRPLPQRRVKDFTEVRMTVQARGTLRQILDFLCDFYRADCLARVEQVNLTADVQAARGPGRMVRLPGRRGEGAPGADASTNAGPDGPRITLSLTAAALVLPESKDPKLPQPTVGLLEALEDAEAQGRLPRTRAEYELVLEKNLFKELEPKVAAAPAPPSPITEAPRGPEPKPEPVTPPPRPSPKVLTAVLSTHGQLMACIRDEERKDLPPEEVRINDPVDGGTLVLVYPRGMIVQVPADHGSEVAYRYYLYKLGARLSERVELNPEVYPELQRELEQALGAG